MGRTFKYKELWYCLGTAFVFMIMAALFPAGSVAHAAKAKQGSFASPEAAVKAMVDAVRSSDDQQLAAIFGPGSQDLISSGDYVDDKNSRERFLKAYDEKNRTEMAGDGRAVIYVGNQEYPFPIPIVKRGNEWSFDTKAGKEELLSRRIGRNEMKVIEVLHAYTDAQREYAARDREGDGVREFAQKLISSRGKKDGLYWETKGGEEESPFGPLIAKAEQAGYAGKLNAIEAEPFHGYYFKVLKAQGANAEGGVFDYVVKGNMVLGFGLVAYPAKFGASGIMTFIINQEDVIYKKPRKECI